jgi:hypothetical protein
MSLRAILEIVVHLDSFRNIDLFFQGLYYVKVSVYNKKNDEVRIRERRASLILIIAYSCSIQTRTVCSHLRCPKRSRRR